MQSSAFCKPHLICASMLQMCNWVNFIDQVGTDRMKATAINSAIAASSRTIPAKRFLCYSCHSLLLFGSSRFFVIGPVATFTSHSLYYNCSVGMQNCSLAEWQEDLKMYAAAAAVYQTCKYHDALFVQNANWVPSKLRGLTLHADLYNRAYELCTSASNDVICSVYGVDAITNDPYRRDPLSIFLLSMLSFTLCSLQGKISTSYTATVSPIFVQAFPNI